LSNSDFWGTTKRKKESKTYQKIRSERKRRKQKLQKTPETPTMFKRPFPSELKQIFHWKEEPEGKNGGEEEEKKKKRCKYKH